MDRLVAILLDTAASLAERDEAAMDLAEHDQALPVLIKIASDPTENSILTSSCGASIAEIWRRRDGYDEAVMSQLTAAAQAEIMNWFS